MSNYNHTTRERRNDCCNVPFEFASWGSTRSKRPRTAIKHPGGDALNQTTIEWSQRELICVVSEALRFRAVRKDCVEGISDLLVFAILHNSVGVGLFFISDFFIKEAMEEGSVDLPTVQVVVVVGCRVGCRLKGTELGKNSEVEKFTSATRESEFSSSPRDNFISANF